MFDWQWLLDQLVKDLGEVDDVDKGQPIVLRRQVKFTLGDVIGGHRTQMHVSTEQ